MKVKINLNEICEFTLTKAGVRIWIEHDKKMDEYVKNRKMDQECKLPNKMQLGIVTGKHKCQKLGCND